MSVQKNKEISISFNKNSFLRFMGAMGMISKEARKSAAISLSQYKKGSFKVLKNTEDLLS